MAWSSGSFSRVRGSASWTNDYNNNTGIEPGLHDTNDQDLAVGINNCLAKDGQNSATGNLDLGGNRLTNVGNAVNAQDTVTLAQAQAGINTQGTSLDITNTRFSLDTAGPTIALRKSKAATVGTNTIVASGDAVGTVLFQGANGTGYTSAASIGANIDGTPGASSDMPGRLGFSTAADGPGTLTERMRIDSQGRVGIGTTSPSQRLHVSDGTTSGDVRTIIGETNTLELIRNGSNDAWLRSNIGILAIDNTNASGTIIFRTNANERMRIDSQGRVGIGTTNPASILDLGNGTSPIGLGIRLNAGSGTDSGGGITFANGGTTNSSVGAWSAIIGGAQNNALTMWAATGNEIRFVTNGAGNERMRITSGGEVYIAGTTDQGAYNLQVNGTGVWGAGAYVNGSDANIKEEVAPISSSLNIVKQLNPVTFKYKEDWSNDRSTQTGFIAQELQEVLQNEIYLSGVVNDSGQYLNVAYQNLIPILTKAIQELSAKVESLEAQLAS